MYRPDTSDEIQKIYDEKVRRLTEEERFLRGLSLTRFCREICLSHIREGNPDLNPGEIKAKFFEDIYGPEFLPAERRKIADFLKTNPLR